MQTNLKIKQPKLVAALGSVIAIGMSIGLAQAGGPIFSGPPTAAIKVSDSAGHSFTCNDNDPLCDSDPNTGSIALVHPLDGWVINVDTGVTKNILGSANSPAMDLSYSAVYNTKGQVPGDGTLTIQFSDVGFLPVPAGFTASIGGTLANGVTGVGMTDFAGPTNTLFDITHTICSLSFSASPYGGSCTGTYTGATPYGLTEQIVLTDPRRTNGSASGDHSLVEAPEPGTLLLMGVALAGLGFVSRRRGDDRA